MSMEKFKPNQEASSVESGEQEKNQHEFMQNFAKSKVGKYLSLLGVGLAGYLTVESQASAGEYKGVLTKGGKDRIEAIRKQRAENLEEARDKAVQEDEDIEFGKKVLPDGSTLYQFKTNKGVEINAIDPGEMRDDAEVVDKPGAVAPPHTIEKSGKSDDFNKSSGSKFFGSGYKWQ